MRPHISIIVPAYNEAKLLPRCLSSLTRQAYPKDKYEIIVVDNDSTDKTAEVAKSFDVQVFHYAKVKGCGPARRYGASKAKGDIIAFFDADAEALPNWLDKVDEVMSDKSVVCVGGRAIPDIDTWWCRFVFMYYDAFHLYHHLIGRPIMGGYNMLIKRSAYEAVGGYDKTLLACEDWDLALRLSEKYGRKAIQYNLGLVIKTSARKVSSLSVFVRYVTDYIQSYINIMIRQKKVVKPTFEVR